MKLETSESLDLLNFGYERCLRNASHGSEISSTSLIVAIYLLGVSLAIAAHLYFTAWKSASDRPFSPTWEAQSFESERPLGARAPFQSVYSSPLQDPSPAPRKRASRCPSEGTESTSSGNNSGKRTSLAEPSCRPCSGEGREG